MAAVLIVGASIDRSFGQDDHTLIGVAKHMTAVDRFLVSGTPIRIFGIAVPQTESRGLQRATILLMRRQLTCITREKIPPDTQWATCFLPDGKDVAAEFVKAGIARDCPARSGGRYGALETDESRTIALPVSCVRAAKPPQNRSRSRSR